MQLCNKSFINREKSVGMHPLSLSSDIIPSSENFKATLQNAGTVATLIGVAATLMTACVPSYNTKLLARISSIGLASSRLGDVIDFSDTMVTGKSKTLFGRMVEAQTHSLLNHSTEIGLADKCYESLIGQEGTGFVNSTANFFGSKAGDSIANARSVRSVKPGFPKRVIMPYLRPQIASNASAYYRNFPPLKSRFPNAN